jgi:hypothetical protein
MTHLPSDCALLITAPLTEVDFLSDLGSSDKDFVKNWSKNQRLASDEILTDEELWKIYSSRIKDFILNEVEEIRTLGAKVFFDVKLGDLEAIFSEQKVITLEAHWFSPPLEAADFINWSIFLERVFRSDEIVAKALREVLFPDSHESFSNYGEERAPDIVRKINSVLVNYNLKGSKPKPIMVTPMNEKNRQEIWIHLNRFALEKTFSDQIKQKCRIEMFDGLHLPGEVGSQIPVNFNGVIDLTVCNSELVGKDLKQTHPNCLVITNRFTTDLKFRLILYKGVMKMLLNGEHHNYIEATMSLRRQLSAEVGG